MGFSEITAQFKAEMRQDRKKAGILAMLLVLAVFMLIKLTVNKVGGVPAKLEASANDIYTYEYDSNNSSGKTNHDFSLKDVSEDTPKISGFSRKSDKNGFRLIRDVFWVNPEYFGTLEKNQAKATVLQNPAHEKEAQLQALKEKICNEAGSLVLEGILLGEQPAAIINGKVVSLKSNVGDFEVVKINEQSVDVRKDGVSVRIEMKK